MKRFFCVCCLALLVTACGPDAKKTAPTEGRRSVGYVVSNIEKADGTPVLGKPSLTVDWPTVNGNAGNKRPHNLIQDDFERFLSFSIGEGISEKSMILPQPLVVGYTVYSLDADFVLQATDIRNGKKLWRREFGEMKGTASKSIGLSKGIQYLYLASGNGMVVATDLTGKKMWKKNLKMPLRSGPVWYDGRIFVTSANNDLVALKAATGQELWRYKEGSASTSFFGMASPAITDEFVVFPTTNGHVNVLDVKTGVLLWMESMWSARMHNPFRDMPHITASPVTNGDVVYVVGNSDKTGAYSLRDGQTIFTQNIGGRETPAVSGNTLFLINTEKKLVAVDKSSGHLYWEIPLISDKKTSSWYGPVLVNNSVLVISSNGDLILIDALTGKENRRVKTPPVSSTPVVASGRIIVLTNDADIIVYE